MTTESATTNPAAAAGRLLDEFEPIFAAGRKPHRAFPQLWQARIELWKDIEALGEIESKGDATASQMMRLALAQSNYARATKLLAVLARENADADPDAEPSPLAPLAGREISFEEARDASRADLAHRGLRNLPRLGSQPASRRDGPINAGKSYRAMFGSPRSEGWNGFSEFLSIVQGHQSDPRLRIVAAMNEATPSAGGFFVPEEQVADMLDKSLESEIVRPRADVRPMNAATLKIAGYDTSDNSASAPSGFSVQWLAELGAATNRDGKVRLIELNANKMAIFTLASNELIADGSEFERMLSEQLTAASGWGLDAACLTGDGVAKPLGVLNSASLITVTKEASQPAATLMYENIVKMFARCHPQCVTNAVWIANSATIPQLLTLQNKVKNVAGTENVGGSSVPVLTGSAADGFTMLTRPVLFTEKLPTLGTKGDLMLVDLSQYVVGIRKEMSIEKSIHVGWQTDSSAYRIILRVDGQAKWMQAFTPKAGPTRSWAVALETRA